SGMTTVLVTKRATRTSVSCTPTSVPVDAPTSCTATVSDIDVGTTSTPSGTVTFGSSSSGSFSSTICTLGASGTCSVTYTPAVVGTGAHLISADYSGDLKHAPSSGSTTVSVTKRSTSTTLGCDALTVGVLATCTATVSDTDVGTKTTPTGTVSFSSTDATGVFVRMPG